MIFARSYPFYCEIKDPQTRVFCFDLHLKIEATVDSETGFSASLPEMDEFYQILKAEVAAFPYSHPSEMLIAIRKKYDSFRNIFAKLQKGDLKEISLCNPEQGWSLQEGRIYSSHQTELWIISDERIPGGYPSQSKLSIKVDWEANSRVDLKKWVDSYRLKEEAKSKNEIASLLASSFLSGEAELKVLKLTAFHFFF